MTRKYHQPSPDSGFLSRAQVAAEFGFSPSYLAHIPLAALPYYKVGTKVLYERATVIAFIKNQIPCSRIHIAPTTPKKGRPRKPAIADRSITQKPQG